jgi:hypothetical protein
LHRFPQIPSVQCHASPASAPAYRKFGRPEVRPYGPNPQPASGNPQSATRTPQSATRNPQPTNGVR